MELFVFTCVIIGGWIWVKHKKKKKMEALIRQEFVRQYPNQDLVDCMIEKYFRLMDSDNISIYEENANKHLNCAFQAWAQDDLKTARKSFQKAGKALSEDDVPQYKLDLVNELISEFADHDFLFDTIKTDALKVLEEYPGILQTEIYAHLKKYSKTDIRYMLYYAEIKGLIKREKKGKTYALQLGDGGNSDD